MSNHFYTYAAFRPNGVICYIGKGSGGRLFSHLKKSHNLYLARIIKKAGGAIPIVKIRAGLTEAEAFETEKALIRAIGRITNGGPLVNMTDGGEGVVGHTRTPEQRARMSVARKGIAPSAEARVKISAKLKGRPKSPEHCAAVSAAKKGVSHGPLSAAHCESLRVAHTGLKRSEEAKAAMRAAQQNMDNSTRARKGARISAALTGKRLSPEHRKKIGDVQRGLVRSDAVKANVRAGILRYRAAQRAARDLYAS